MDNFTSIEQMFPNWKNGRQIVEELIPQSLVFNFSNEIDNSLILDCEFIGAIKNQCIFKVEQSRNRIKDVGLPYGIKLEIISGNITRDLFLLIEELELDYFPNTLYKMNNKFINSLNEAIYRNDLKRHSLGKPTSIDIIKHHFGIKKFTGSF